MIEKRFIDLELKIIFKTPFIMGSGFGIAGLVDSTTVKDNDNIVYLPSSTIKGKIKSEFKKNMEALNASSVCNSIISGKKEICQAKDIKDVCVICRIFGSEFYEGNLFFEDAVLDTEEREIIKKIEENQVLPIFQSSVRTGIRINRKLKTAEEGALFILEGTNPDITFKSRIYGLCYMTDDEYGYLKGAIESITHLGGNKSRGMGRCKIELMEKSA